MIMQKMSEKSYKILRNMVYRKYLETNSIMSFTQFELFLIKTWRADYYKAGNKFRLSSRKFYKPIYLKIKREIPIFHKRRLYTLKLLENTYLDVKNGQVDMKYLKELFNKSKDYLLTEDQKYLKKLFRGYKK
jgi:hypothetical protein